MRASAKSLMMSSNDTFRASSALMLITARLPRHPLPLPRPAPPPTRVCFNLLKLEKKKMAQQTQV